MQFKVPQDVQQADKIVSFLTLPQLIICVVGFGIAYGVYTVLVRQGLVWVFWFPPVFIIVALTAAFAFLRIANLPFHRYLALVIERFVTPSKRVWVKGSDRIITSEESLVTSEDKKAQEKAKETTAFQLEKEAKLQNIGEITDMLDTLKKEPEEAVEPIKKIDTTADEDLLHQAFLGEAPHGELVPANKTETPEEKIMAISSTPKLEPISKPVPTPVPTPVPATILTTIPASAPQDPNLPQKKKRRRRRKKKGNEITAASTPPLPAWLNEKPEVKKEEVKKVEEIKVEEPKKLEAKAPEPIMEVPESEPMLAAPEQEPILPAPEVEPMLDAPKNPPKTVASIEIAAVVPTQEPIPLPRNDRAATAKTSETLTAEDLKQGKTITFS